MGGASRGGRGGTHQSDATIISIAGDGGRERHRAGEIITAP